MPQTVDVQEIDHFDKLSQEWWDEAGPFAALHQMNPLRIQYILDHAGDLKGKQVLDIGCGGGLLSEPLSRLGANMTSIDASEENIKVARLHAEKMDLKINYIHSAAEDLKGQFDVVTALEIIEHVQDADEFIKVCVDRVKPGGLLFLSTLNRTFKAWLLAVKVAENVLRMVPKGTHQWQKFVRPKEMQRALQKNGCEVIHHTGVVADIFHKSWKLSSDDDINYLMVARKR